MMSGDTKKRNDVVALIIGRGNNTLKNKNILPVYGIPLLHWGAIAAKRSEFIGRYYISSDDEKILEAGKEAGYTPIVRPDELATPNAQSSDAVRHAHHFIEKDGAVSVMIVIHANVGTISTDMIDDCIGLLLESESISSVVPSHKRDEYHALRAKKINEKGLLVPFVDTKDKVISANRQDLETCLFFDHSFWVLDVETGVKSIDGQQPWPVMGKNILPYITEGCFDVHDLEDLEKTEIWIAEQGIRNIYIEEGLI